MFLTHWHAAKLLLEMIGMGLLIGAALMGLAGVLGLLLGVTLGMADWVRTMLLTW